MLKAPKLPTTITILGRTWDLKIAENDTVEFGSTEAAENVITLNLAAHRKFPAHPVGKTLFHEAIHAALETSGLADLLNNEQVEEAICIAVENGLYPLVKGGFFR